MNICMAHWSEQEGIHRTCERMLYYFFVLHNYDEERNSKYLGKDLMLNLFKIKPFQKFLFLFSKIYQYFLSLHLDFE